MSVGIGLKVGLLKRTIESAPTRPRERAKDDFTMLIINVVVSNIKGKTRENSARFEIVEQPVPNIPAQQNNPRIEFCERGYFFSESISHFNPRSRAAIPTSSSFGMR